MSERLGKALDLFTTMVKGRYPSRHDVSVAMDLKFSQTALAIKQGMQFLQMWDREEASGLHELIAASRVRGNTALSASRELGLTESQVKQSLGWKLGRERLHALGTTTKHTCEPAGYESKERGPDPPPPETPDYSPPGSQERIEALARRYRSRRHIWHPGDAKIHGRVTV